MSVESLHSQASPHVPDGQRLVRRGTHEEVREGLEVQARHRVSMGSVLLSGFQERIVRLFPQSPGSHLLP